MSLKNKSFLLIGLILIVDQAIKITVKTNMYLGSDISVFGDWFKILFTENPGMAFGLLFGGPAGKILLVIFRIVLSVALLIYIPRIAKREGVTTGFMLGLAGICAGALGNIIDSAFYGLIFNSGTAFNSEYGAYMNYQGISQLSLQGYAPLLHGCVVDMFYFPIIKTTYPQWFPFWAGEEFIFFRPVFNFADASISVSGAYILLFQRKALNVLLKRS
ncbi:MAG: lipoprotein signal peptidase [Prevotellaceae bacterium]|jgi:signal peptidase II|nr:lipoprotein signal peptidase [Prevotellaceae bacterium]